MLERRTDRKVPAITGWFWVVKILTTAMGEAASDYSVERIDPVIAVVIGAIFCAATLVLQLSVRRYIAWTYWLAASGVAVFGTMCADVLHVRFGVPYAISAALYAGILVVIFVAWQRVEGTLSIHSIHTLRRELFYWAAIIATFALGTATGDMTATTLHLGYLASGFFFLGVICIPAIGFRLGIFNAVFAFWFAYVITRPLGASFADWMGVARSLGGLGWGREKVAAGLAVIIVVLVGYLSVSRVDVQHDGGFGEPRPAHLAKRPTGGLAELDTEGG